VSVELKDLRAKVTARTDAVLEGLNRATGKDKSEIVRDVLDKWAEDQVHAAMLIDRCLQAQGEPGIAQGASGNMRERP
jgi:hypothetical protein